jgi:drug/metabolite transporter (DMT)-like permease
MMPCRRQKRSKVDKGPRATLNHSAMAANPQSGVLFFSMCAVLLWGASDFTGGYAARRTNAFLFTAIAHFSGMIFMTVVALAAQAGFPNRSQVLWSLAAGSIGGISLPLFFKALASGKMGLAAPISAVLGAALPTIFSIATEGFPGIGHIFGFVLAGIGVWLISRAEDGGARPEGLGLAVLAGIGFAGFYICIRQAGEGSAVWTATIARAASFLVTSAIVLVGGQWQRVATPIAGLAAMVGLFDVSGSMAFIRASQAGRLDEAVVLSSLYPVVTVLLARVLLHEHFTRWKLVGMIAALVAVPLIA